MNKRQRDYQDYLMGDWWKDTRLKRLKLDGFCCVICKSKLKLNVHHLTYDRIGRENVFNDLITLCSICHAKVHKKKIKIKKKSKKFKKRKQGEPFRKYKKRGICILTEKDINHKKPDEFLIKV